MSILSLVARGRRPAPSALRPAPTSATELAAEIEGGSPPVVDSEIPGTATSLPRPVVPVVDPSPRSSAPAPPLMLDRVLHPATPGPVPDRPAVTTSSTPAAPLVTPSRPGDLDEVAPPQVWVLPEAPRDDSADLLRAALDLVARTEPSPHQVAPASTFIEPPASTPVVADMAASETDSGAELRALLDRGQREVARVEATPGPVTNREDPPALIPSAQPAAAPHVAPVPEPPPAPPAPAAHNIHAAQPPVVIGEIHVHEAAPPPAAPDPLSLLAPYQHGLTARPGRLR